jgi:hypothetical protein
VQEPTHILAGVAIQKSLVGKRHKKMALAITAVGAFLSHGFLDKLSNITFHPADPDLHSVFWVSYHLAVLFGSIFFLYVWWRTYKLGILFSMLPDADWIFIHAQEIFHFQISFYRQPHLHHLLGWVWDKIPPFSFVTAGLNQLPNWRHDAWACLSEMLLVLILLVTIRRLRMAKQPS